MLKSGYPFKGCSLFLWEGALCKGALPVLLTIFFFEQDLPMIFYQ